MKTSFKLATSYMKRQRGKTLALLVSVGLSVMLIFSTNVIRDSGYESEVQEAKDLYGDYTVRFDGIDKNSVDNLSKQPEIKSLSKIKYFCEIVNTDNGVKLDLNSFDKAYIDSLKYEFVQGRPPSKDGEIVIEEKALNQMGIKNSLNKNMDFMLLNKYLDDKVISQIDSTNKSFKVVGIVKKPDKYYESINGFKTQAFIYKGSNLPIKTEDTYKGTIYLKSENDMSSFVQSMIKKLNIDWGHIYENIELLQAKSSNQANKINIRSIINSVILVIVSIVTTYNIFNIILADMINQIGMMRAIGMSKRKIKKMFRVSSTIYIILGTLLGIVAGCIFSYIGVFVVYGYSSKIVIEPLSIILSFTVSIIAVSISNFITVRKSIKISIIDSIRNSDKYKRKSKNINNKIKRSNKSILMKFVVRNMLRNKSRTVLTIIAISMVGTMFIFNYSAMNLLNANPEIFGGVGARSYGNIDITLSGNLSNTESLFYKIDDSIINKVKDESNVNKVEPNFYNKGGYLLIEKDKLSNDYLDELKRVGSNYNKEYPLLVKGYSDSLLKNRDSFIKDKTNTKGLKPSEYKQVILVNNFYSKLKHSFSNLMSGVKVGDVLEIKLPVYKNGLEKYENFKVQVAGIMKDTYISSQDGDSTFKGGQIILKEEDYKELTNQKNYNRLFIMSEKDKLSSVEKELEKIVKNHSFTSIGGKNEDKKLTDELNGPEERLNAIHQFLIFIILSVNIIFIVRSNIIAREKELSIFRAIGMSSKSLKKIILLESTLYGLISSILSTIVATILYNRHISRMNNISLDGGFTNTVEHHIPFKYIIMFFIISVVMCLISVYFSKDKLDKSNIVEGISKV
ncbi:ABC transporter permease [Paraclostridium sordellii]|uniref:ABC transporter permease n=1 Tax=Paraclostridium sordellii TaxID=1505 RepID=UPI0005E58189|nr:FtsX-like permease family protein [Paeniclostridium sordellii]CEO27998.1 ABC transporter permease [[Clostridium] sordellii] [Paeniclostridium sordellii]